MSRSMTEKELKHCIMIRLLRGFIDSDSTEAKIKAARLILEHGGFSTRICEPSREPVDWKEVSKCGDRCVDG